MFGLEFTKNQRLALYAIIGLIVIAISIKLARNSAGGPGSGVALYEPGQNASVETSDSDPMNAPNAGKVIFHITGSVKSPNVYVLPRGSRIIDGIKAAGGARKNADLDSMNLAAKIEDGSRIYVPSIEDRNTPAANPSVNMPVLTPPVSAPAMPVMSAAGPSIAAQSTVMPSSAPTKASGTGKLRNPGDGVVNINSAGADELQRLPGVGPSTAEKILEYRRQIGRFVKPEQIMDVKGIGPKKYEKMRPFITI